VYFNVPPCVEMAIDGPGVLLNEQIFISDLYMEGD
jgi:hypothetical protein